MARQQYGWQIDKEESVTYLPLSHIAGAVIDIFVPFQARKFFGPKSPKPFLIPYFLSILVNNDHQAGGTVWFADRDALKGSLVQVR